MKTQTFGVSCLILEEYDSTSKVDLATAHETKATNWTTASLKSAYNDYRANRENGEAQDSPSGELKYNGKARWESHPAGHHHVKYTEGPSDKAWMEAKDRNYVFRLEREGTLDQLEPNLQTEVPKLYEEVMAYRAKRATEVKEQIIEKPKPMG